MSRLQDLQQAARQIRVLYVEDNVDLRISFHRYLQRIFQTVVCCENGAQGLAEFRRQRFDLVITDINMPQMDGLSMAEEIRKLVDDQHIVIVSAYQDLQNYIQAIRIGIDGYLLKPMDYEQLNMTLLKVVTQINTRQQNEAYRSHLEQLVEAKTAQIRQQYVTDELTGLGNRNRLDEKLSTDRRQTLLLLDIAHFGMVNDNLGFSAGDRILSKTAEMLQRCRLPEFELFRLPGDQFALLSEQCSRQLAWQQAEQIQRYFDRKPVIDGAIELSVSFYIAIDCDASDLLRHASLTIHAIKQHTKSRIQFYQADSEFELQQKHNLVWLDKVKAYLDQQALCVFFQPIMDIHSGEVHKYEALARIVDKQGKTILPGEFIQPLKLAGLTTRLTRTIIDLGLQKISGSDNSLSINITSDDLRSNYLPDYLLDKVSAYQLTPAQVILEILESISTINQASVIQQLTELKRQGFQIAIDDFGTQESNFSRFLAFDFDYIKIDGSFIQQLQNDGTAQQIVRAIVSYAHATGARVVAEYVSNEQIFNRVKDYQIDFAQGHYIGCAEPGLMGEDK